MYLALVRALLEAVLYLLSHLHFMPKVFYVAFSIVNDAALLLYTNKAAVLLGVAERDRDQVANLRAASVPRTKTKSSSFSLVDDRATWHGSLAIFFKGSWHF